MEIEGLKSKLNILTYLLFSGLIILIYACGGGGSGEPNTPNSRFLKVVINFPDDTTERTGQPDIISRSVEDLDTCTIIVNGGTPPMRDIILDFGIDELKRITVPIGENRMFTFIGKDVNGQPLCKGETTIDISPETNSITIGCEFVDEICTDGIDNDFDDLIDCADPDCDRSSCDSGVFEKECVEGSCVIPTPAPTPSPTPTPTATPNPACPDPSFPNPFPNPNPAGCFTPKPPSCYLCCYQGEGCFCCEEG